ncbi:hypothetical protein [Aeromonas caviae]|uniref:hypothetical protein n=1 Tax=Aeromonas caviae TaxID=648 RepID=UPI002F41F04A
MIIEIVNGDFKERKFFTFTDNNITFSKLSKKEIIPIREVVEIKKEETLKGYCYITFTLSDKKSFIAKIKEKDYVKVYESFISHGNKPDYITLPQAANGSPKTKYGSLFLFFALIVIPIINGGVSGYRERAQRINIDDETHSKSTNEQFKKVTDNEFERMCQYAIALDFSKDPSIVKIKKPYNNKTNMVAVGYTRKSDKTIWNFECKISTDSNVILWRSNPGTNTDYIGRWRDGNNGGEGNDSLITYTITSNKIQVTLKYPDGGEGHNLSFTRE